MTTNNIQCSDGMDNAVAVMFNVQCKVEDSSPQDNNIQVHELGGIKLH